MKSTGQDYQTIRSDRIPYFEDGDMKCIRIDSAKYLAGDSILYPFKNIQELGYECFTPYGPSWVGGKVIIKNNGLNLFFNKNNDTITINTKSKLNESWLMYMFPDSARIIATVTGQNFRSILGLEDSVKTIYLQVYDKGMNPVNHNVNSKSIEISQHYGFLKILNFYYFPDYDSEFLYDYLREFTLAGLSDPPAGKQNLTWIGVHNYEIGDEIHVYDKSDSWGPDCIYEYKTIKTIRKIIGKEISGSSKIYTIEIIQSKFSIRGDDTSKVSTDDTIVFNVKPDPLFDKLPDEPVMINGYSAYANTMYYSYFTSKIIPPIIGIIQATGFDSCWSYIIGDGCFAWENYTEGLGGPYYECSNAFCGGGAEVKLVYYKKGGKTWGTPLIITDIPEKSKAEPIHCYPNPFIDKINIELTGTWEYVIKLMDINGRIIKIEAIMNESKYSIHTEDLTPGIYFLVITGPGTIGTYKMIKN